MSAVILIHQDTAVHLVSDACTYDMDARITSIQSNIRELPNARAAYRVRGAIGSYLDVLHAALDPFSSIEDLLTAAGPVMRVVQSAALQSTPAVGGGDIPTDFELSIIGWSGRSGAPTAWVVATHENSAEWDLPGYKPYVPQIAPVILARPGVGNVHATLGLPPFTDIEQVWALDPGETALSIMEAQRAQAINEGPLVDAHVVGGFVEMASISAAGMERRLLRTWPDKVGHLIRPAIEPARRTLSLIAR